MESKPLNSEKLMQWAASLTKVGIWELDLNTLELRWSKQTYEIHGVDPSTEPNVETAIDFYLPEDRPIIAEAVENCRRKGEPYDLRLRIKAITGEVKNVRAIGHLVRNDAGNPARLEGVFQDITDYSRLTEEIQVTQKGIEEYLSLLDKTSIIAKTDKKGIITYVNNRFCDISKFSREELIGQDHRILNSGFHPKAFFANLWKTIAAGKDWTGEIKNKCKDGEYYWVDTLIHPVRDQLGDIEGYLSIRTLITKKKEQQEMDIKTGRLVALGEASAQIMHDVMNPLSLIQGAEYALGQIKVPEAAQKVVERARDAINENIQRINDIFQNMRSMLLDDVTFEKEDIQEIVGLSVKYMEKNLIKYKVSHQIVCPDSVPIIGNKNLLIQVFTNLMKNSIEAIDLLEEKWIRIEVTPVGKYTFIRFIDSGHGISKQVQEHMFDSFFTTKKGIGGSGIGLGLCKKIVELHGGEIRVNQNNKNTEIDVIL